MGYKRSNFILLFIVMGCTEIPSSWQANNKSQTKIEFGSTGTEATKTILQQEIIEGVAQTAVSASTTAYQVIEIEDIEELAGMKVEFPPGSLAFDTEISIQAGASIAEAAVSSLDLGGEQKIIPLGSSLVVSTSVPMDASGSLLISLPFTGSTLHLNDINDAQIIVLFKVYKQKTNTYSMGLIPSGELEFKNGSVSFKTMHFGSFQLAKAAIAIEAPPPEVETSTPILTKATEIALPKIEWTILQGIADDSARTIEWQAEATSMQAITECTIFVDRDKVKPWDLRTTSPELKGVRSPYAGSDADTYFFKISCEESSGRVSESPWSNGVKTGQLQSTVAGLNLSNSVTNTAESAEQNFTVAGKGIVQYAYAFLEGANKTCSSAVFSTYFPVSTNIPVLSSVPGPIVLCVKGKDPFGNVEKTASEIKWQYTPPVIPTVIVDHIPGNPSNITVDPTDQAFLIFSWEQSAQQASPALMEQSVAVFDSADCQGTPLASMGVSKTQLTAKWHRFSLGIAGPFYFNVIFTDTLGRINRSACSQASPSSELLSLAGTENSMYLGAKVHKHDVTGDGLADLILSYPQYQNNSGYIAILPAGPSISASAMRVYVGTPGDWLGNNLYFGDINGDGIDDIIGGYSYAQGGSGVVYILPGASTLSASGPITTAGRRYSSQSAGDGLGSAIKLLDLNVDGILDIVIGANLADQGGLTDNGSIYVIFGTPSLPINGSIATAANRIYSGETSSKQIGGTIYAEDITGDGKQDLINFAYNTDYSGHLLVIEADPSLPASGDCLSGGKVYTGDAASDYFGSTIYFVDVTNDGIKDIVSAQSGDSTGKGSLYLIPGSQTLPDSGSISVAGYRYIGDAPGDQIGTAIKFGDFNGDGVTDIFAGYHTAPGSGAVYVALMSTTPAPSGYFSSIGRKYHGNAATQDTGLANTYLIGDVTGDGMVDIVAGSQWADNYNSVMYIIAGSATPPASGSVDLVADRRYAGNVQYEYFAGYQTYLVDVTGDGTLDIISASASTASNSYRGYIWLLQGQEVSQMPASGSGPAAFKTYEGDFPNDGLGSALEFVDINGDGKLEIIAGNSYASSNGYTNNGSVFIIPGQAAMPASGAISAVGYRVNGTASSQNFGNGLGNNWLKPIITDFNDDGFADFLVKGSNAYTNVAISYGDTAGNWSPPVSQLPTPHNDPLFGRYTISIDLLGNGKQDLVSLMAYDDGMYTQASSSGGFTNNGGLHLLFNAFFVNP